MDPQMVARINELARKSKAEGLTQQEKKEQQELRSRYIAAYRQGLVDLLDHTYIQDPQGNRTKLKRRSGN